MAYRDIKQELYELLKDTFGGKSEIYRRYKNDHSKIDYIFQIGAEKARAIAAPILDSIKDKIGLR